ncbi:MAG: TonB-dependent receptor [Ignavibacteriae bacterium]|nr:TonB-dependent receptor [Ignavibacteriota bacterium]
MNKLSFNLFKQSPNSFTFSSLRGVFFRINLFLFLSLFSTIIFSQTGPINTELNEVIVSANKYETTLFNTASSVSVITSNDIQQNQNNTVVDVLNNVPGISVVQQGATGKLSSVFMRGANSNFVLVLVDDVEMNDPASSNNGFDFSSLEVSDIERIEIVRGPQSTLYGSEAAAGVINILTKTGNGSPSFNIKGEGGSNNFYNGNISASGKTNSLNYYANLSRIQTDAVSSIKGKDFENDGFANNSGFLKLGYEFDKLTDLNFSYKYVDTKTDLDQSSFNGDDPNFTSDFESHLFNAKFNTTFFEAKWESSLRASYYKSLTTALDKVDAARPNTSSNSLYDGRKTSINWQNNLKIIKNNIITIGFDSKTDQANSVYNSISEFGPFDSEFPKESITTSGVYIQDIITLQNFSSTIGYRFDNNEKFGSVSTFRIAPMYFISSTSTKVKGTYGTGFKAPSLFNLFAPFYGNINLKPEKSSGWDLGFEQFLINNKVSVGVTYFNIEFKDMLGYDENFRTININKAQSSGIETTLQIYDIEGLNINAHYTYNSTNDISSPELEDEQLIRRPKNQFAINMNYKFNNSLNLGLSVNHSGERFDNDFSTFPSTRVSLKAYTLVDFTGSYQLTNYLRLFARVENLLNTEYENILYYGTLGRAGYLGFDVSL